MPTRAGEPPCCCPGIRGWERVLWDWEVGLGSPSCSLMKQSHSEMKLFPASPCQISLLLSAPAAPPHFWLPWKCLAQSPLLPQPLRSPLLTLLGMRQQRQRLRLSPDCP